MKEKEESEKKRMKKESGIQRDQNMPSLPLDLFFLDLFIYIFSLIIYNLQFNLIINQPQPPQTLLAFLIIDSTLQNTVSKTRNVNQWL